MKHFFITGMPRSRMAWLANLFTTGESFCYMEWTRTHGDMREMNADCEFVGNSDCGLAVLYPDAMKTFGNPPFVIIMRNPDESLKSLLAAFPYFDRNEMRKVIYALHDNLLKLSSMANVLTVCFDDLNDINKIKQIWSHCVSLPFNKKRAEQLQHLRIVIAREEA